MIYTKKMHPPYRLLRIINNYLLFVPLIGLMFAIVDVKLGLVNAF